MEKKLVRSKSGLRIVSLVNDSPSSPLTLTEPLWVPDKECPQCVQCNKSFDFLNRRHHCRRCGKCFCSSCCGKKSALPRMCFVDPVLQCSECIKNTKKENEFFDKHLKNLLNGAQFRIESTVFMEPIGSDMRHIYVCKLSNNHREMILDCISNNIETHDLVELVEIESLQILTSGNESPGGSTVAGLAVMYKDTEGVIQTCKLLITDGNSQDKKQALAYIAAFRLALKLVFESRKMSSSS